MDHILGIRMETIPEKYFAGKKLEMSFSDNRTKVLWQGFMPALKDIKNKKSSILYSLQIYPPQFFEFFNPDQCFTKWALTEVSDFSDIPAGMHPFTLPEGLYAVFLFKGTQEHAESTFRHIFYEWLPVSGYVLDQRPHFEILGSAFKKDAPDSEEEIWIPIKSTSPISD